MEGHGSLAQVRETGSVTYQTHTAAPPPLWFRRNRHIHTARDFKNCRAKLDSVASVSGWSFRDCSLLSKSQDLAVRPVALESGEAAELERREVPEAQQDVDRGERSGRDFDSASSDGIEDRR